MTGVLTLNTVAGNTVFSGPIAGSGHLDLALTSASDMSYELDGLSTKFVFESAAAPTPEPTTMFLFASGLVVAGARKVRRRH